MDGINTDDLISKLVSLESEDLANKKKRKSSSLTKTLLNGSFSEDLVPSPIKVKPENELIEKKKRKSKNHTNNLVIEPYSEDLVPSPIRIKPEYTLVEKKKRKSKTHTNNPTNGSYSEDLLLSPIEVKSENDLFEKKPHKSENLVPCSIEEKSENYFLEKKKQNSKTPINQTFSEDLVPSPIKEKLENDLLEMKKHDSKALINETYSEDLVPSPIKAKPEYDSIEKKKRKSKTPIGQTYSEGLVPSPIEEKPENNLLEKKKHKSKTPINEMYSDDLVPSPIKLKAENEKNNLHFEVEEQRNVTKKTRNLSQFTLVAKENETINNLGVETSLMTNHVTDFQNVDTDEDFTMKSNTYDELNTNRRDCYPASESFQWIENLQESLSLQKKTFELCFERNAKYSLLRIPKKINPNTLLDRKCSLTKNTCITINDRQYLLDILEKNPEPVIINFDKPKIINLDKIMVVQKLEHAKPLIIPNETERTNVSLPDTIKTRHPLFGVNYKRKVVIDGNAREKMLRVLKKKDRPHKRKKSKVVDSLVENNLQLFI